MESNDSPEIPDRGETSDIPGLPSGEKKKNNNNNNIINNSRYTNKNKNKKLASN